MTQDFLKIGGPICVQIYAALTNAEIPTARLSDTWTILVQIASRFRDWIFRDIIHQNGEPNGKEHGTKQKMEHEVDTGIV